MIERRRRGADKRHRSLGWSRFPRFTFSRLLAVRGRCERNDFGSRRPLPLSRVGNDAAQIEIKLRGQLFADRSDFRDDRIGIHGVISRSSSGVQITGARNPACSQMRRTVLEIVALAM